MMKPRIATQITDSPMLGMWRDMESFGFPQSTEDNGVENPVGALSSKHTHGRLGSSGFGSCTALLVENKRTGEVTAFHLSKYMNLTQLQAFAALSETPRDLQAFFVQGKLGTPLEDLCKYEVVGRDNKSARSLEKLVKHDLLPNVHWLPTIRVPYKCWEFGYDTDKKELHIGSVDDGDRRMMCYKKPFEVENTVGPNTARIAQRRNYAAEQSAEL